MENILIGASVPVIATAVYFVIELIKYTTNYSERVKRFLPLASAVIGVLFGLICFYFVPDIIPTENVVVAIVIGAASGLTATGFNQIIKQSRK
jgi:cobalamin synthase